MQSSQSLLFFFPESHRNYTTAWSWSQVLWVEISCCLLGIFCLYLQLFRSSNLLPFPCHKHTHTQKTEKSSLRPLSSSPKDGEECPHFPLFCTLGPGSFGMAVLFGPKTSYLSCLWKREVTYLNFILVSVPLCIMLPHNLWHTLPDTLCCHLSASCKKTQIIQLPIFPLCQRSGLLALCPFVNPDMPVYGPPSAQSWKKAFLCLPKQIMKLKWMEFGCGSEGDPFFCPDTRGFLVLKGLQHKCATGQQICVSGGICTVHALDMSWKALLESGAGERIGKEYTLQSSCQIWQHKI